MSDAELVVREIQDITPPKECKVIYVNDNVTSFEFVSESLVQYFNYEMKDAENKAVEIHNKGSSVVAILPFEIAEQRGVEVLVAARHQGYPLDIKLEQE